VRAIDLNCPTVDVYVLLCEVLHVSDALGPVTLRNGDVLTLQGACLRALKRGGDLPAKDHADVLRILAGTLPDHHATLAGVPPEGRTMTRRDLYREAVTYGGADYGKYMGISELC
jgi:hypothetical protein